MTTETLPAEIEPAQPMVLAQADIGIALRGYQALQAQLDKLMPDGIIMIQGKKFRKRKYWEAVATAFNLSVELCSEEKITGEHSWGWICMYRASAPNGRFQDADGACWSDEVSVSTVHNVRSKAHTRARCRAIASLVGFSEIAAEEVK